jgi:hypothetical protein
LGEKGKMKKLHRVSILFAECEKCEEQHQYSMHAKGKQAVFNGCRAPFLTFAAAYDIDFFNDIQREGYGEPHS